MASSTSIAVIPPNPLEKKGNLAENWRKWKQNFDIYLVASGISDKEDRVACAHFLHTIGQYGRDIYNELDCSEKEVECLQTLCSKFENFCNPKTNLTFNRYQFFTTKQEKKQPFDNFLITLKQKSKNCEFGDLNNSLLMTQIISGITNIRLRERLLRKPDLDLNQTIEECRATEISEAQAQEIAAAAMAASPNVTKTKPKKKQPNPDASPAASKPAEGKQLQKKQKNDGNLKSLQEQSKKNPGTGPKEQKTPVIKMINCIFCGSKHLYGNCPAFGSTCAKCQKPNHLAAFCKN